MNEQYKTAEDVDKVLQEKGELLAQKKEELQALKNKKEGAINVGMEGDEMLRAEFIDIVKKYLDLKKQLAVAKEERMELERQIEKEGLNLDEVDQSETKVKEQIPIETSNEVVPINDAEINTANTDEQDETPAPEEKNLEEKESWKEEVGKIENEWKEKLKEHWDRKDELNREYEKIKNLDPHSFERQELNKKWQNLLSSENSSDAINKKYLDILNGLAQKHPDFKNIRESGAHYIPPHEHSFTPNKVTHSNEKNEVFNLGDDVYNIPPKDTNRPYIYLGKITGFSGGYAFVTSKNMQEDARPTNTEALTKTPPPGAKIETAL